MKKILIIKPSGIGDIVHSLPVAIGIKKLLPECSVHWLVFSKFANILNNIDSIEKVILWDRNGGLKEYCRIINFVQKENYDLVIDLQVLIRTAILSFFSKGKQRIATSFVREFANIFEKPVGKFNPELHAVERSYEVLNYLFPKKQLYSPYEFLPWLKIDEKENLWAKKFLGDDGKYVLFSVGSRGEHKIWPKEYFTKLINMMFEKFGIIPVFVGMQEEEKIVEDITQGLNCSYANFVGKTSLRDACAIINNCCLTISNDSGLAHISAALDKPTIIIFGPTNPKWFYPYNKKSGFVFKNYKCSPCGIKTNCKDYKCMQDIKPEEVFEYIKKNFSQYICS